MTTENITPFVGCLLDVRVGDCRELLKAMPNESVQCCVTSPPYWGLRDYGHTEQIGREVTPDEFVKTLVEVFREVRRVLKKDGTLWLNLGDSYCGAASDTKSNRENSLIGKKTSSSQDDRNGRGDRTRSLINLGIKQKDLVGIPWMVAFALRADGWYLRQDIIWSKPNPMPESVTDRCTKSHEYIFLLSKSAHYYYDNEAIKEQVAESTVKRLTQDVDSQLGSNRVPGKTNGPMKAVGRGGQNAFRGQGANREGREMQDVGASGTRNKRSVWSVATKPYKGAHFATYPPDLIKPCIMAGTKPGDVVLDPFGGSGTTGEVALELGRRAILLELNPNYAQLIHQRANVTIGLAL